MNELVLANLKNRPLRTLISVVGVALGVVLVLLFSGLARGMSNDMVRRASNWKAEIMFTRPGANTTTSSNASLSTKYVERLQQIEGVQSVIPIIKYITPSSQGVFGLQQIDGLDFDEFAKMNEINIIKGRAAVANDEVVIDEREAEKKDSVLGSTIEIFGGKPYKVVGIFSPPSGARIKMSLAAMQNVLEVNEKCTFILVKLKAGESDEIVAKRIKEALPNNTINLTKDLIADAEQRFPQLTTFLQVLVGLGAFVCGIFVLLSMYTTITERRREIGVLKSLGASKTFIISTIEREAFLIGILGTILGFAVSFIAAFAIQKIFGLAFEFGLNWMLTAIVLAIAGSLIGALYPALRAASIDPVEVLASE